MKQPRRWTALLAVLLMVASLVFAPEASASPVRGMQLPGDPPTLPEIGEPDVPPSSPRLGPCVQVVVVLQCVGGVTPVLIVCRVPANGVRSPHARQATKHDH
jgi:hypothetical protein